jgi:hypothetical protein
LEFDSLPIGNQSMAAFGREDFLFGVAAQAERGPAMQRAPSADLHIAIKTRYSVSATSGYANSARFVEKGK